VATSIPRSPVTRLETKSVANPGLSLPLVLRSLSQEPPASVEQVDAPANTVTPTPTAISTTATTSTSTITTCGATSISATQPAPVSRPVFVLSDSVGSNWIAPEAPNSGPKPPTPNQPRSVSSSSHAIKGRWPTYTHYFSVMTQT
jgi:hypothetical protein